jgi:hypothetical protein
MRSASEHARGRGCTGEYQTRLLKQCVSGRCANVCTPNAGTSTTRCGPAYATSVSACRCEVSSNPNQVACGRAFDKGLRCCAPDAGQGLHLRVSVWRPSAHRLPTVVSASFRRSMIAAAPIPVRESTAARRAPRAFAATEPAYPAIKRLQNAASQHWRAHKAVR